MKQIVEVRPARPGNPVELVYGIGNEKGAVVLVINTGWGADNGQNSHMRSVITMNDYYPETTGLWWHTTQAPPEDQEHFWCDREHCEYVGGKCWSQVLSNHQADELLGLLRREGLAKVWIALESIYRERVND